jgi:hypothetical protein
MSDKSPYSSASRFGIVSALDCFIQVISFRVVVLVVVILSLVSSSALAGDAASLFLGAFQAVDSKKNSAQLGTLLSVAQSSQNIEITYKDKGGATVSRLPMDGSEVDFTPPGGMPARGKVNFRRGELLLEYVIATKPFADGPVVRLRHTERWQLSDGGNSLTIRGKIDFPGLESATRGVTDQSYTEIFRRIPAQ